MAEDFPITAVLDAIEPAVARYPKATMHELADDGFRSLFQQVVACLVSIRTYEETTMPICRELFAAAPDPASVLALGEAGVLAIIRRSTFADRKAPQIVEIARRTVEDHGGEVPCDMGVVRGFDGIGVKCANLALGIACGLPLVCVDVHVHRIANRWGYVATRTPEKTTDALDAVMPDDQKVRINRLLVPFGKFVCTAQRPRCSTCPVRDQCARVDVTDAR
jgi:endonuclease III